MGKIFSKRHKNGGPVALYQEQAVATPVQSPAHPRHGWRSIWRCNMPNDWRGWGVSALMLLLLLAQLRG